MRRSLIIIFLIHLCLAAIAQINVSVGWDKDTIDLGDEVNLLLFVKGNQNVELTEISDGFLDSLISGFQTVRLREGDSTKVNEFAFADAEIVNYGRFSIQDDDGKFTASEMNWESSTIGGELLYSNRFKFRIWDPGQIIATSPRVSYDFNGNNLKSNQQFQAALFVRPPIDVSAMEQDSFDISPIKTIIKEPIQWSDYKPYFIGLLVLSLLIAGYWAYHKYLNKIHEFPVEEVKVIIPAHKIALDKLHDLDEKKLWQSDIKGYQSELTYIVREYLENRYNIPALESTSDEIVTDIKKKDISTTLINEMKNILQVADLVKFAKSKPSMNIHQEFMEKALSFVRETKKIDEPAEISEK